MVNTSVPDAAFDAHLRTLVLFFYTVSLINDQRELRRVVDIIGKQCGGDSWRRGDAKL